MATERNVRFYSASIKTLFALIGTGLGATGLFYVLSEMGLIGTVAISAAVFNFATIAVPLLLVGIYYVDLFEKFKIHRLMKNNPEEYDEEEIAEARSERNHAIVETFAFTLFTVGVVLGLEFVFGAASVASFGILPLALIITGVCINAGSKFAEIREDRAKASRENETNDSAKKANSRWGMFLAVGHILDDIVVALAKGAGEIVSQSVFLALHIFKAKESISELREACSEVDKPKSKKSTSSTSFILTSSKLDQVPALEARTPTPSTASNGPLFVDADSITPKEVTSHDDCQTLSYKVNQ